MTPRYSDTELWERAHRVWREGGVFHSLVHGHKYTIIGIDEGPRGIAVRYSMTTSGWRKGATCLFGQGCKEM